MKILMLTSYLPYPPVSGGQVRSYNLIKNLAKKHAITLFSLIKDDEERKYIKELEKFCQKVRVFRRPAHPWTLGNILRTGFGFYPFLVIRNFSSEEKKALQKELKVEKYDLIHAENFYVMPHIPQTTVPLLLTEQTIFYRVFQHFVESLPWYLFSLKLVLMIDVWKLKYWESFYWRKVDFLTAVSEEDVTHIKRMAPGKRVYIVPNGVDFNLFGQQRYSKNKFPTVLFGVADFHWMQNKEGARILVDEVWPVIKKEIENARLWIVGKIAPEALASYSGLKDVVIQEIDDSREAYQRSWILVAPMRSGGGSRTKFFEAMASGLPIVTTPEGVEGIKAKDGEEIFINDDLKDLAEKALMLLKNKDLAEKVGRKAKRLVKEKYSWQNSAQKLDRVYQEVGRGKES